MTKEEADLIIAEQNKSKEEILKAIADCEKCYSLARAYRNDNEKLKAQNVEMQCCGNCRFSESDKLNGTFCHREGCFVVASAKCKLWER